MDWRLVVMVIGVLAVPGGLWLLAREFKRLSLPRFLAYALETLRCRLRDSRSDRAEEYRSVRKMLDDLPPVRTSPSEAAMVALRSEPSMVMVETTKPRKREWSSNMSEASVASDGARHAVPQGRPRRAAAR